MTPKPPIPKLQSLSSETVIPEELKVELEHQPYRGTFEQEPLAGKASESCSKSLWNEAPRGEGRLAAQAAILNTRSTYIVAYTACTIPIVAQKRSLVGNWSLKESAKTNTRMQRMLKARNSVLCVSLCFHN